HACGPRHLAAERARTPSGRPVPSRGFLPSRSRPSPRPCTAGASAPDAGTGAAPDRRRIGYGTGPCRHVRRRLRHRKAHRRALKPTGTGYSGPPGASPEECHGAPAHPPPSGRGGDRPRRPHRPPHGVADVTGDTYARRSARVLVLDSLGRVLLLRHANGEWFTPGGGVDDGEDLRQAAVRELREEIGLEVDVADLGLLVAVTSGYASLGWVEGVLRDDYFLHRVDAHTVDTSGLAPHERYTAHRWWTA